MTRIEKKVKEPLDTYASYFFTKKVVQKIRIEGSRCRSDLSDPCSHSSLFLFALGLKDGNRRILDCFPPYCNKRHFFPQSFSFFLSFAIVSSNLQPFIVSFTISRGSLYPIQICSKQLSCFKCRLGLNQGKIMH